MDPFEREHLDELLQADNGVRATIFMPTHRSGKETRQNPIRLRNLIAEAAQQLDNYEKGSDEILAGVRDLIDDNDFWQHQADGLAIFAGPDGLASYRLPISFEEKVVVGKRFHIKPLLPLISGESRFFVLAVSQNETRMFVGSRQHMKILELESVPESLASALAYDDPEKQLQWHTGSPGGDAAVFHGHGGNEDDKEDILRYFRQIDKGLSEVLRGERAPLILAAVDYEYSIYREANSYPNLLDEHISGNPERLRPNELHERAWAVVEPIVEKEQQKAMSAGVEAIAKGAGTTDISDAVRAAIQGRVDTMFVERTASIWGRLEPDGEQVIIVDSQGPKTEDLSDLAAAHTLRNGGKVYALDDRSSIPGDGALAAILRS